MKKTIKILAAFFILYTLLGFFLLPKLLLPKIQEILNNELNATITINALYFNPLTFTARLSGIGVSEKESDKRLLELAYAEVDVDPLEMLYGTIAVGEIYLQKPTLYVRVDKRGKLNLLKITKQTSKEPEVTEKEDTNSSMLPITLKKFVLHDGVFYFDDNSKAEPFHIELHQLFVELHDLDTRNLKEGGLHLQTKIAQSGHIELYSKIERVDPLILSGSFGFEIDDLSKEFAYVKERVDLHLTQGRASFFTKYSVDMNDTAATALSHMNFSLYDIKTVANENNATLLDLDYLYVNDIVVKPFTKEVRIPHAGLKSLLVNAQKAKDGTIDWMHYLRLDTNKEQNITAKDADKAAKEHKTWRIVLEDLVLDDINVAFEDKSIKPNVRTSVDKLAIDVKNITLAGKEPLRYDLSFFLNKTTPCSSSGTLRHANLDLRTTLECKDIDIVHYRPYIDSAAKQNLKRYNIHLVDAKLDTKVNLALMQESKNLAVTLNESSIKLKSFALQKRSTREKLVSFRDFAIDGITFDSAKKEGSVAKVELSNIRIGVSRYKNGHLNIEDLVVPKKVKKEAAKVKKSAKQEAFHFLLKEFRVTNGRVDFRDKMLNPSVKKSLRSIYITLKDIDSKKNSWLSYRSSMRFGTKGKIRADGKLRHTPLKQQGSVTLSKIALVEINPYLEDKSYLKITDGYLWLKTKERYMQSKKGPDLNLKGDLSLGDFSIINTNDENMTLLAMQKVEIKPFTLELNPNRVYVNEVLLNGFYVAAKIDENKSINFAKLMKKDTSNKESVSTDTNTTKSHQKSDFDVKVAKVTIKDSQAFFEDLSLPIKFKTDIHTLNGVVYSISNKPGETTFVNIDGEVDAYGSTKIKGSLDSFNPKKFTDMNVNFQNLDLSAMSGYSASFAGYTIESGKLFLDLGYKITDSKLLASNNVVIKHIKLGKEIEGDDVKHLPLGFVLGLLEDSNGIIDIELPIEGDLDKPDFKYGKIVWNTLANLITKAVTSPFRFLGSMLGIDTQKLSALHFEYAKAEITPPEREKLDTIVKIMKKRPKILLALTPVYDSVADKKALQLQKLIARVMQKSGDENIHNSKNALTIEMLEDIYSDMKDDDKAAKLKKELRKKYEDDEVFERAYQNALIELVQSTQDVSEAELVSLAKQRAMAIQNYLMEKGIVLTRIVLNDVKSVNAEAKEGVELPLSIEVKSSDK